MMWSHITKKFSLSLSTFSSAFKQYPNRRRTFPPGTLNFWRRYENSNVLSSAPSGIDSWTPLTSVVFCRHRGQSTKHDLAVKAFHLHAIATGANSLLTTQWIWVQLSRIQIRSLNGLQTANFKLLRINWIIHFILFKSGMLVNLVYS